MPDLLLDTCAAIWIMDGQGLQTGAEENISEVIANGGKVYVSPMTAWEVSMLASRGRIQIMMSPLEWFRRLVATSDVFQADLAPEILVNSNMLPGSPPKDPVDRIVIATARERGLRIVTRDRLILDFADQGHVLALPC